MLSFFGACSAYTSHLKKIQIKQNHIIRVLFFATLYEKSTESAQENSAYEFIRCLNRCGKCFYTATS